jgi:CBS domain-containing protein
VAPDATVREMVVALHEHRVGALVVSIDGRTIVGIVSERDVVNRLASDGSSILDQTVEAIMTREVHTCSPSQPLDELNALMTNSRFRHLPVVVDGALAGIISIGDVVKARMGELAEEKQHLTDYITQGR